MVSMQASVSDMFKRAPACVEETRETKKQKVESDVKEKVEDEVEDSEVENDTKNTITLDEYRAGVLGNGQTGPGSIWLYAKRDSSVDSQSLSGHTYDPAKPLVGFKLPESATAPCPYGLIAHALDLIECLKASGSGSRKKTIVVLTNLVRLLAFRFKAELIHAIYLIINKVGPDYEGGRAEGNDRQRRRGRPGRSCAGIQSQAVDAYATGGIDGRKSV